MKNKSLRTASVLAIATLLTTSILSGTFAKYTTTVSGTDTAIVAKWDVKAGEFTETSVKSVDIFKEGQVYDLKTDSGVIDYTSGVEDNDVIQTAKNSNTVIAPGTWGKYTFKLENKSDVTANYSINYSVTNTNKIPLKWSTDKTTWYDSIEQLNVADQKIEKTSGSSDITLYWKWEFTDSSVADRDVSDTTLGNAGTAEAKVDISVTFDQVD